MNTLSLHPETDDVKPGPCCGAHLLTSNREADVVTVMIDLRREDFEALRFNAAELAPSLSKNEGFEFTPADVMDYIIAAARQVLLHMAGGNADDVDDALRGSYLHVNLSRPIDRMIDATRRAQAGKAAM